MSREIRRILKNPPHRKSDRGFQREFVEEIPDSYYWVINYGKWEKQICKAIEAISSEEYRKELV